jgi:hypothetical protein
MRGSIKTLFILIGILLLGAPEMLAQVVGGTINGTVVNAQGTVVAGAKVTLRNTSTGTTRELTTGADGRFFAPSLLWRWMVIRRWYAREWRSASDRQ